MKKLPELLSPAGGKEQARAAAANGADAVYIGGKAFNARINAGNFDMDQLREILDDNHVRDIKTYIAMNTLIKDEEMAEALEYAGQLYEMGADALIVQDMGLAATLRKYLPLLDLHLSTQGTVYNTEGITAAAQLGFKRVVPARELSLEEIKALVKTGEKEGVEIEVFVHGALCMCYSGQCQMSREIGGRSGNRGQCAQPCRLPYRGSPGAAPYYPLSPKDLCLIDHLPQLAEAGVSSLKIEGRMKSPEYVAIVTAVYRKYLDMYSQNGSFQVEEEDYRKLRQIFNRGDFTDGYLSGPPGRHILVNGLPKHQGIPVGKVEAVLPRKQLRIGLKGNLEIGDGVEIHSDAASGGKLPGNVVTYMLKTKKGVNIGDISGDQVKPGDLVYKITDKKLMEEARATYEASGRQLGESAEKRKPAVNMMFKGMWDQVLLEAWDTCGNRVKAVWDGAAEPAVNKALTEETVKTQLKKMGSTPFRPGTLKVILDEGISIPVSVLNQLRRQALDGLESCRRERGRRQLPEIFSDTVGETKAANKSNSSDSCKNISETEQPPFSLTIYLHDLNRSFDPVKTLNDIELSRHGGLSGVDLDSRRLAARICLPYTYFLSSEDLGEMSINPDRNTGALPSGTQEAAKRLSSWKDAGFTVVPVLPAITRGAHDQLIRSCFQKIADLSRESGIFIGNLGWLKPFIEADVPVYGDYGLNLINSSGMKWAESLGLSGAAAGHDFDPEKNQALDFYGLHGEAAVGGKIPAMITACPVQNQRGKPERLIDRKGESFPVMTDGISKNTILFSCHDRMLQNPVVLKKIRGLKSLRIYM